jgi:hypothetical protein
MGNTNKTHEKVFHNQVSIYLPLTTKAVQCSALNISLEPGPACRGTLSSVTLLINPCYSDILYFRYVSGIIIRSITVSITRVNHLVNLADKARRRTTTGILRV